MSHDDSSETISELASVVEPMRNASGYGYLLFRGPSLNSRRVSLSKAGEPEGQLRCNGRESSQIR